MAEVEEVVEVGEGEEENYQPPPEKSIDALMEADQVSIICSKQLLPSQKKCLNLSGRLQGKRKVSTALLRMTKLFKSTRWPCLARLPVAVGQSLLTSLTQER